MYRLAVFLLSRGELGVEQENTTSDDGIEGSSDFVTHIRQDYR